MKINPDSVKHFGDYFLNHAQKHLVTPLAPASPKRPSLQERAHYKDGKNGVNCFLCKARKLAFSNSPFTGILDSA